MIFFSNLFHAEIHFHESPTPNGTVVDALRGNIHDVKLTTNVLFFKANIKHDMLAPPISFI